MMLRSFLKAFGYVMAFLAGWAVILFVGMKINEGASDKSVVYFALVCTALIFLTFVPFLNFAAKRSFHFRGQGTPVSGADLRRALLSINDFGVPVVAMEKKRQVIVTWKYVDAKWWETFAKAGLKKVYALHVKLHEKKNEAVLIDVEKDVEWGAGPAQVRLSGGYFRGIELDVELGVQWGINENFHVGKTYDFKFQPSEIRNPVLNTILRSGWDVRLGMW
jgi:hypothetical protein